MNKEELKKRTKINWRNYISESEALDALVMGDQNKILEIKNLVLKCQTWQDKLYSKIDSGDQKFIDNLVATFKSPKKTDL